MLKKSRLTAYRAKYINGRNIIFLFLTTIALFTLYPSLKALILSTSTREYYSHIALIPLISAFLIYLKRKNIFLRVNYSYISTLPLITASLVYIGARYFESQLNQNDFSSIIVLSMIIFVYGIFILFYGVQAFKAAIFPLMFLIFMIPVPSWLMDNTIYLLQVGSTEFVNVLLMASGVPFFREGFVFHLPGQSIEVAPQCSGIRSSLALLITSVLAGHLLLRTWWKKIVLLIFIIPVAMFKNGIRITTLTLLGTYVDPRIMQSSLHREGGIPFFILALVMMVPVLYFLRKTEKKKTMDTG